MDGSRKKGNRAAGKKEREVNEEWMDESERSEGE